MGYRAKNKIELMEGGEKEREVANGDSFDVVFPPLCN